MALEEPTGVLRGIFSQTRCSCLAKVINITIRIEEGRVRAETIQKRLSSMFCHTRGGQGLGRKIVIKPFYLRILYRRCPIVRVPLLHVYYGTVLSSQRRRRSHVGS